MAGENPLELGKDAVELAEKSFDLGYKIGNMENAVADVHHDKMIQYNEQREQVLAQENADFDMPDVNDFG